MHRYKFDLFTINDVVSHFKEYSIPIALLSIQDNIYLILETELEFPQDQLIHLSGEEI